MGEWKLRGHKSFYPSNLLQVMIFELSAPRSPQQVAFLVFYDVEIYVCLCICEFSKQHTCRYWGGVQRIMPFYVVIQDII